MRKFIVPAAAILIAVVACCLVPAIGFAGIIEDTYEIAIIVQIDVSDASIMVPFDAATTIILGTGDVNYDDVFMKDAANWNLKQDYANVPISTATLVIINDNMIGSYDLIWMRLAKANWNDADRLGLVQNEETNLTAETGEYEELYAWETWLRTTTDFFANTTRDFVGAAAIVSMASPFANEYPVKAENQLDSAEYEVTAGSPMMRGIASTAADYYNGTEVIVVGHTIGQVLKIPIMSERLRVGARSANSFFA